MAPSPGGASGAAGRRGPDVGSDGWIKISPTTSGGLGLKVLTKVEVLYGEAIRRLVRDVLTALGVSDAQIEMEDSVALPFVQPARFEATVRQLHPQGTTTVSAVPEYLPEFAAHAQRPPQRDRFRRSRLYLPGNEPKFMLSASLHGPDGVVLDLEDSVGPPAGTRPGSWRGETLVSDRARPTRRPVGPQRKPEGAAGGPSGFPVRCRGE